jgi:hypothetical protein
MVIPGGLEIRGFAYDKLFSRDVSGNSEENFEELQS